MLHQAAIPRMSMEDLSRKMKFHISMMGFPPGYMMDRFISKYIEPLRISTKDSYFM